MKNEAYSFSRAIMDLKVMCLQYCNLIEIESSLWEIVIFECKSTKSVCSSACMELQRWALERLVVTRH